MAEGDPICIIPHHGVDDDYGSLELWFADGRKSVRFYWDNQVSRRLNPNTFTRDQAIEKATALAKAEIDKLEHPRVKPGAAARGCHRAPGADRPSPARCFRFLTFTQAAELRHLTRPVQPVCDRQFSTSMNLTTQFGVCFVGQQSKKGTSCVK
jgi:hypothetical protein